MKEIFAEFDEIRKAALSADTVSAIKKLLNRWEALFGGEIWTRTARIDFTSGFGRVSDWLQESLQTENYPDNLEALCFALGTNPENDSVPELRISGSDCFILESDGFFQDFILSDAFIPEHSIVESPALEEIGRLIAQYPDDAAQQLLPFAFSALAAAEACRTVNLSALLGEREALHLAAVHDSGFPLIIGSITRQKTLEAASSF